MKVAMSRREFLKLSTLAFGAVNFRNWLPENEHSSHTALGRVTIDSVRIRSAPSFKADRIGWKRKDQLINILEEVSSPEGPDYNSRWYRTVDGFIHSGYIQKVKYEFHQPVYTIPESGRLAEVSVPYTTSFRIFRRQGYQPLYRLYCQSMHWVTGITQGPDGNAWYQITDDRLHQHYYAPASHFRTLTTEEIEPISPEIHPEEKRIEVSLEEQIVRCFENDHIVFQCLASTGVGGPSTNDIPRDTPQGKFRISWKMPVRHMGEGDLTSDLAAYELPGVPWCSFFVSTGVAFHGAYWHDNFGKKMSSGCVNLRPDDAKWVFRWTSPAVGPTEWFKDEPGTIVVIQ